MSRCFGRWKGFSCLTGYTLGAQVDRHADPDQPPAQVTEDYETIERLNETKCATRSWWGLCLELVAQQGFPAVQGQSSPPAHVLRHSGLRDLHPTVTAPRSIDPGRPPGLRDFWRRLARKAPPGRQITLSSLTTAIAPKIEGRIR